MNGAVAYGRYYGYRDKKFGESISRIYKYTKAIDRGQSPSPRPPRKGCWRESYCIVRGVNYEHQNHSS